MSTVYRYIKVTLDTQLYDMIDGGQVNVGTLIGGESYTMLREDSTYYYVKFGNHEAYFSKALGTEVFETFYGNKNNLSFPNSNDVVVTSKPVVLYENIGDTKGYAVIKTNIRTPIVDKQGDYYRIDVGNRLGYALASQFYVDKGIPVLMYHHMVESPYAAGQQNNNMVIAVSQFKEQMDYLKANGYRTILMTELDNYLFNRANLTGRVVVITFDDGYLSTHKYAVPIMRAHGQKATNFAIGGRIRQEAAPWDAMGLQYMGLKEMDEAADVLNHQHHTHAMHLYTAGSGIAYMIDYSFQQIVDDLLLGQIQIDKAQSVASPGDVKYLAYPFGHYDDEAISASVTAGIRMAVTTARDQVRLGAARMELPRQGIAPRHTLTDFINKLNGTYTE